MTSAASLRRPAFSSDHRPWTLTRAGAPWIAETEQARISCAAPPPTLSIQRSVASAAAGKAAPHLGRLMLDLPLPMISRCRTSMSACYCSIE